MENIPQMNKLSKKKMRMTQAETMDQKMVQVLEYENDEAPRKMKKREGGRQTDERE